MTLDYFEQYAKQYGGLISDLLSLPPEVIRFLNACQYSIKNDIKFISNYKEIYDFRPEFDIGFFNTAQKSAFTCTNETFERCFIGISLGLILTMYNIIYEALAFETDFLDSYFENAASSGNKTRGKKIKDKT